MNRYFIVLCSALVCAIVGCSTPSQKPVPSDQSLSVEIKIRPATPQTNATITANPLLHIWMQPVVGGVSGNPTGRPLVNLRVHGIGKFTVSLAKIESGLAAAAKAPPSRAKMETYDPVDTRVARLGTLAENLSAPAEQYFTSLRDPQSEHTLILIYVDRPCTIHGSNSDLVLTRPGRNWLERVEPPNEAIEAISHYKVREATQEVVYFLSEFGSL
jgi:hypothetical protein